jgi:hypothetical protein
MCPDSECYRSSPSATSVNQKAIQVAACSCDEPASDLAAVNSCLPWCQKAQKKSAETPRLPIVNHLDCSVRKIFENFPNITKREVALQITHYTLGQRFDCNLLIYPKFVTGLDLNTGSRRHIDARGCLAWFLENFQFACWWSLWA